MTTRRGPQARGGGWGRRLRLRLSLSCSTSPATIENSGDSRPVLDPAMPGPVRRPIAVEIEDDVGNEDDAAPAGGPVLSGAVARAILGDGRVSPRIPPPAPLK